MNWILRVDNLSKVYRLGAGASQRGTLYEQVSKRMQRFLPQKKNTSEEILEKPSEKVVVSNAQTEGLAPGHFWALKNISFQVSPGERIGLIGQNGSGKSTLLKILSRITAQSHGEFRYKGHLISLLEVGTGFHPELTGRENIFLNAAINGMNRQQIKARFKEIVDFSELGGQIDTPVKRYSSGMYMRLAFSVAAFLESEILLIDEVLAVGDQGFQKKCKEKMLEVANDGRSVIFVSHDMSAIESICKKTIEMSHGEIVEIKDVIPNKTKTVIDSEAGALIEDIHSAGEQLKITPLCAEKTFSAGVSALTQDVVQLVCVKLLNEDGILQEKFTVNESISLEIQCKVLKDKSRFNVRFDLANRDGVKILSSIDHHCFDSQHAERASGFYKETVIIPKEYLNEGQFNISIYIHKAEDNTTLLSSIDCLSFKIIDNLLPVGVRANWSGAWPEALLRPDLVWKTKYSEEAVVVSSDLEVSRSI